MKAKKFFAGMSAAALAMSLAAPALATNPYEVIYTGEAAPAVSVNIDVPTAAKLYFNPYGLNANLKESAPAAATGGNYMKSGTTFEKLYSDVKVIVNRSTTPLQVKVTGGVTPAGNVEIAANPTRLLDNEATVYFEIDDVADPTITTDESGAEPVDTRAFDTPEWTGTHKITLPEDDGDLSEQDPGYTLKAAEEKFEVDPFTNEKTSLGVQPSYAAFHLGGDLGAAPTGGWGASDLVSATVAFSFTPVTGNAAG